MGSWTPAQIKPLSHSKKEQRVAQRSTRSVLADYTLNRHLASLKVHKLQTLAKAVLDQRSIRPNIDTGQAIILQTGHTLTIIQDN